MTEAIPTNKTSHTAIEGRGPESPADGAGIRDVPVIFAGMPRSGTTMLGSFAQTHLDVAAVNEGTFEPWLAAQSWREQQWHDKRALRSFLQRFSQHYYFTLLFRSRPPRQAIVDELERLAVPPTIQSIGQAALIIARNHLGLAGLGHEGPALLADPRAVLKIYPCCRFVHIVRDPRDAAASVLKKSWGPNNACVYAGLWMRRVAAMRQVGKELGPKRYFEFRYEDILAQPETAMRALMQFVCGVVDEDRLASFLEYMESNPRRANYGKWKTELTPRQARTIEAVAWDQMSLSQYELPPQMPRMSAAEGVFWQCHSRIIQISRILRGRLRLDGGAKYLAKIQ